LGINGNLVGCSQHARRLPQGRASRPV
jgi:hypothetical protein